MILSNDFFDRDAQVVAKKLLGKVIRHRVDDNWLSALIIETEAYYRNEKGSHSSLGRSPSREAMFMEPGTIYMYYARGRDSLNVSCKGEGNAVLVKSGFPWIDRKSPQENIEFMQELNLIGNKRRDPRKLCSGQTLLCSSLGIKVSDWNKKKFNPRKFYIEDVGKKPNEIIQTTRVGIPAGRDEDLPYRFVEADYNKFCSKPVTNKKAKVL